jgi:hypothetical protein
VSTDRAGSSAAQALADIRSAIAGHTFAFSEREALKLVDEPLRRLKAAPEEERLAFVFEALERLPFGESLQLQLALKGVVSSLLRAVSLTSIEAVRLVQLVSRRRVAFPHKAVLSAVEAAPRTPALREALLQLRSNIDHWLGAAEMRDLHERIDVILHGPKDEPVVAAAAWSQQVFQEIDASARQFEWRALFLHARSLTQSTASRKWQSDAVALIERIGRAEFLDAARRWLALGPMPGSTQLQTPDAEADYQKGFIWALGALRDTSIAPEIADFALACFRKIPMIGAVSHRVGNACVNSLAIMPGLDAVSQISRLAVRVKYDVARRLIEKALAEAAERNHVSRDDLEAMSVPGFGLDTHGFRLETAGDCQARLGIEDGEASLTWSRDGKPLKSVPADVKAAHGELIAELKKAAKELDAVLSTQRLRLERQLLPQSTCRFDRWKAWYLDHPVVSCFARRLVWEFEANGATQTGIFFEGKLVDWAGNVIDASAEANVRLWHPIRSDVQSVLSWRCWLEDHGFRQPFKQAHREVYLLTDAERQTGAYSNRFAAHIVRQHQFAALCRERSWQFNLMGQWDSHNTPYLDLPQHKLRIEFDVEFPSEEEITGHGVYLAIRTGQVRFMPLSGTRRGGFEGKVTATLPRTIEEFQRALPQPLRLEEIPAVVFSEVMRDCDLLVGVTSIGADPAWNRDHPADPHAEYWRGFAFGELGAASENRKSVVAALLPKLAIRDRCRIDGRFLVVRGQLHEYRIHLGSGNVIIEPGSRYLCIVQGPGDTAARVHLPFDGDRILAVILSKALLLADDVKIKDETIRRQL